MDTDRIAARLQSKFDCAVHVLASTSVSRPTGARLTTYGNVERTLRGRLRVFNPDTDTAGFAGAVANTAKYLVTTSRFSQVPENAELVVVKLTDDREWHYRLRVIGVRGPVSTYVSDQLACTIVTEGAS